jgi:hypothetical protein
MTTPKTPGMDPDEIAMIDGMLEANALSIQKLNDALRIHRMGGTIVITPGIAGLGPSAVNQIMMAITSFNGFNGDNDPYAEHDCAVMTVNGVKIIWKIDYFDLSRTYHSPNPADLNVTSRVMTVMRADEY